MVTDQVKVSLAAGSSDRTAQRVAVSTVSVTSRRPLPEIWLYLKRLTISHWMLLFYPVVIRLSARARTAEQAFEVDPSALVQIGFTAVCGVYALTRFARGKSASRAILTRTPMVWLLLYGTLALVSVVWSEQPEFTLYRAVESMIFLVLVVDATVRAQDTLTTIKFQMVYAGVFVVLGTIVESGLDLARMHSSEVPGTVVAVVFLGFLARGWVWRLLYAIVLVGVAIGTSSATYVSVLVGIAALMLALRGKWSALGALVLAGTVALGFVTNFDLERYVFWGKSEREVRTASGRLLVWDWVVREKVSQKPVLGYGFGAGETLARLSDPRESTLQMMHMHSAGMSALANLGGVGLFLLLMTMLGVGKGAWKLSRARAGPALVGATAAVFVNSQIVASVTSTMSVGAIGHNLLFATVAVAAYVRARRAQSVPALTAPMSKKPSVTPPVRPAPDPAWVEGRPQ